MTLVYRPFGLDGPNETALTSAGQSDIFVAKYTVSGALVWHNGTTGPVVLNNVHSS